MEGDGKVAHVGEAGRGSDYRIQWAAHSPSQPGGADVESKSSAGEAGDGVEMGEAIGHLWNPQRQDPLGTARGGGANSTDPIASLSGSNPSSASQQLCDLGEATLPLCATSSRVQWGMVIGPNEDRGLRTVLTKHLVTADVAVNVFIRGRVPEW